MIENKIMQVINGSLFNNGALWSKDGQFSGYYVWVDVKVNDYYLPDWLMLNLEAMRKKRGARKVQRSLVTGQSESMM